MLCAEPQEFITLEQKRALVKSMTNDSWNGYVGFVDAELTKLYSKPEIDQFFSNNIDGLLGVKIVEAMSTLWVMKMRNEFERGRKWIAKHLNPKKMFKDLKPTFLEQRNDEYKDSVERRKRCHRSYQYFGPLLSCYALTQDELFLNKTKEILDVCDFEYDKSLNEIYGKLRYIYP